MAKRYAKNIYYQHGAYYYVRRSNGLLKWTRLGKTEPEMLRRLSEIKQGEFTKDTMEAYFKRYSEDVIPGKAPRTQINNEIEIRNLNKVFGHMKPHQITPVHIYRYMDERGKKSKYSANLEKALLSSVFSYLIEWGAVSINPCQGVRSITLKPRTRYIEDEEYKAVYKSANPIIKAAMEIAVITGMRQGDILALQYKQLKDDGIHLIANKTGKKQIFTWTKDLKKVVSDLKKMRKTTSVTHLISTGRGQPYTSEGFKTMWQRTMNNALKTGVISERFTFRDLRPKAASDHEDGTKLLAHTDAKTTKKYYLRKPTKVTPLR